MKTNINMLLLWIFVTIATVHAHSDVTLKQFTKVPSGGQIMGNLQAVSMWKSQTHLIYRQVHPSLNMLGYIFSRLADLKEAY